MPATKILVVDDDTDFLASICRVLVRQGYEVLATGNPRQALELLRDVGPFDLVLSDIKMPEMPGTQLVREIAEMSPRTASVLMTGGRIHSTDVPEGVPTLKKPFSTRDLMSAVEKSMTNSARLNSDFQFDVE